MLIKKDCYLKNSCLQKDKFGNNVNEVIRDVLNSLFIFFIYFFFMRKDFACTSTKSTKITRSAKSTKSTKSTQRRNQAEAQKRK